jgi:CheY-like chemotaxis protein
MFRIVIAAGDVLARTRLAQLVSREPGLTVVGHAGRASTALAMVRHLDADVVLVDLSTECGCTLQLISDVRRALPAVLIVAVLEDASQSTVTDAFSAGASAFLRVGGDHRQGHEPGGWTFVLPEEADEPTTGAGPSLAYVSRGDGPPLGRARLGRVAADHARRAGSSGRRGRSSHGCR